MSESQNRIVISDIGHLAKEVGVDHTASKRERLIAKELFKGTSCGISFYSFGEGYVVLSGYCEGTDFECYSHQLDYPFTAGEFWKAVEQADNDGCAMWDKTHGCEDCWGGESVGNDWGDIVGPHDYGRRPVDDSCGGCGGRGMIL